MPPLVSVQNPSPCSFNAGAEPRAGFLEQLRRDAKRYQAAGVTDQVLLSFTSDPYHPGDTTLTRQTIEVLIGVAVFRRTRGVSDG